MGLAITVQDGFVQSVEAKEATTRRCPSCHRDLPFNMYAEDQRTSHKMSPTCKTCRARGIMTYADAKAGKTVSPWSLGKNNPQSKIEPNANGRFVDLSPEKKPETSEQKVVAALQLVLESLDFNERAILVRILTALQGANT